MQDRVRSLSETEGSWAEFVDSLPFSVATETRNLRATSPMIHPWHDVTPGIEGFRFDGSSVRSSKFRGSNLKFEIDKGSGMLKVDRVLLQCGLLPGQLRLHPADTRRDDDPL